jgi:hypothetical protein
VLLAGTYFQQMRFAVIIAFLALSACQAEQRGVAAAISADNSGASPSASAAASSTPSPKAPATAGSATWSATIVRTLCSGRETDETARVFVGRDARGAVTRYRLSPPQNPADLGELYFDSSGRSLGQGVALIPLGDPERTRELEAREAQLQGGATFAEFAQCADTILQVRPVHE